MSDSAPMVVVEHHGAWIEVILNRPERRNAIVGPVIDGLLEAFDTAEASVGVGAVVLRGAGPVFCAGLDLKAFTTTPAPSWLGGFPGQWAALHERLWSFPLATIAVVDGAAVAAGAALALACDFLVMGAAAELSAPEVRMGISAPLVGQLLTRKFGAGAALRVTVAADPLRGVELASLGIAHLALADDVLDEARTLAERIGGYPPGAVAAMKDVIRRAAGPLDAAAALELGAAAGPGVGR